LVFLSCLVACAEKIRSFVFLLLTSEHQIYFILLLFQSVHYVIICDSIIEEQVNLMGDLYARVKWQGYPDSYNSWILKSTLIDNSQEIEDTDNQTDEDTIDR